MKNSPVHSMLFHAALHRIACMLPLFTVLSIFTVGCDYFFPPLTGEKIEVEEAERFISRNKDNPDIILLDIRPKTQYDSVRIENSINLDFTQTDFPEMITRLDPEKRYILIDDNGRKSAMAFELMKEQRFPKVHYIAGGLTEWVRSGYKTVK
ncbi:MAG: rhodanese-like domain-containing protein [Ignavibacteria bacterium]|nr:rhodanese-like domain-containing protein [Ignavibacteria bacterium]